jgi:putative peptidoglycan lipid II flippase
MGILNAHQKFWLPAIAPAMYSLGQILGVLLLPEWWGVTRLALGALAGALLHLLVQLPGLLRLKGKYHLMLGLRMAEVREVLRLMGPRILGVAVVQINFIVNIIIGISLPVGSVSALTLAFTLMLMPQTAIAQSIAIAAMPTFSAPFAGSQPAWSPAAGSTCNCRIDSAAYPINPVVRKERIYCPVHPAGRLGLVMVHHRPGRSFIVGGGCTCFLRPA